MVTCQNIYVSLFILLEQIIDMYTALRYTVIKFLLVITSQYI